MAGNSKSGTLTQPNGGYTNISVSWSETSTSVSNNTSTISITGTMSYGNARWDVTNSGTLQIYWHDNRSNSDTLVNSRSFNELGYNTNSRSVSGSINVTHKDDGTLSGYAFAHWERQSSYGGYAPYSGDACTDWTALTTIARASQPSINSWPNNSPDFNIGDTITIHMNRKSSSFTHTVKINYSNTSTTIATGVTDNCTFNTSSIADALYALIPSATSYSGTISVTTYNGSTNIGTKTCAYNAKAVEANVKPTFSNFTYQDSNSAVTAITGNNQYLVQGKSTLKVTISSANKAVAKKSASISKYQASFGSLSASANYSTSDVNMTFSDNNFAVGSQNLSVKALDSRGYSTAVTKSVNVLAYAAPVINASATRQNNFENNTTLKIGGTYSPLTINSVAKNTIQSVKYRYKRQSETWGSQTWYDMTGLTVTPEGNYTTTDKPLTLSNTEAWDIEIEVVDRLSTVTVALVVSVGIPIFRIGTDGYVYNNENRILNTSDLPLGTNQLNWSELGRFAVNGGLCRLVEKSFSFSVINGDTYKELDASSAVPSGYTALGIVGRNMSGNGYTRGRITLEHINTAGKIALTIYSDYGSTQTWTYTPKILCIRTRNS